MRSTATVEHHRPASPESPADRRAAEVKLRRLNAASQRRVIDPDEEVPGGVRPGRVGPDEHLSIHGLDLDLTEEQRAALSREEAASMYTLGLRIEAALIAGFAAHVVSGDVTDPRTVYRLHEMGEETRHSRVFSRLIESIGPESRHPVTTLPGFALATRWAIAFGLQFPATFNLMVLAGEEIPDLLQRRAIDHPGTDPFIAAVARYHRQEEARHISFAKLLVPELWAEAGFADRIGVRRVAPLLIQGLFDAFIHPGVYAHVGLPPLRTWLRVRRIPARVQLRREATRPVLATLIDGGVIRPGRVNRRWRALCGVDRHGAPLAPVSP